MKYLITSPVKGSIIVIPAVIAFTRTSGLILLKFLARSLGINAKSSYN